MNNFLKVIDKKSFKILKSLNNPYVFQIISKYAEICRPKKVTVLTGDQEDLDYVRKHALENGEEKPLRTAGHTIHFDGLADQGRDRENTRVLVEKEQNISRHIHAGERKNSLVEIFSLLKNSMKGKEMYVLFYCLGPKNSPFSLPALQITDSSYVAHTENILYRQGFEEFIKLHGSSNFFHFIHSSGELENHVCKNTDKRRIYIDLSQNRVFSVNTQYAGNSAGLKKLALRLAILKADKENWLCEHMFLMGAKSITYDRTTYFAGAFPSACGKTSTAMIEGQTIIGDDIVYIRKGKDCLPYAVNVEQGIFGIIENVNALDDPLLYKLLQTPKELIFSNVLVKNGKPFWLGMGGKIPDKGTNFVGNWQKGMKDKNDKEIPAAHKNARYTVRLKDLSNVDKKLHDPDGIVLSAIIYGGRDSDTSPPVVESFNWNHGVMMGASLESETTAATLGATGVRKFNPMANLDFLVIPLGKYIANHLNFGNSLKKPLKVFTTNYFLKEKDVFLNGKLDKKVWLIWMEGRVHREFSALETPIGFLPRYDDLCFLFAKLLRKKYSKTDYEKQFSLKVDHLLNKLKRIEDIYLAEIDTPDELIRQIEQQRRRLVKIHSKKPVSPFYFS